MFSEKEIKLARLALDSAAPENEWNVAAVKFFSLIRSRAGQIDEFEAAGANGQTIVIPPTKPDYGLTVFPFGKKHKGELFKDIPPGYLIYQRDWIRSAPDIQAVWGKVADAIDAFLGQ
jgi:hypothetical protein